MPLVIRNTKTDAPRFLRMVVYGDQKVGKTTFSATFPRPFFFSVGAESGVSSLTSMDKEVDYTLIENRRDMAEALVYFRDNYKKKDWRAAIVDTATVYGRMSTMEESRHAEAEMNQQKWNKVLGDLLNVRDVLHNCEVHVVWVMHVDDKRQGDFIVRREPKLVGAARTEIIQTCGLCGYMDKEVEEIPAKLDEKGVVVEPPRIETVRRFWVRCPKDMRVHFETGSWYEQVLDKPCYKPDFAVLAKYLAPKHIQSLIDNPAAK